MKKLLAIVVLCLAMVSYASAQGPGAIWTTRDDCGTIQQDVNHYAIGETVYINGANFDPDTYDWTITGQPGMASCDPEIVVANGTVQVDESGAFCFAAYVVQNDDCGEYTADVDGKNDNYRVDTNGNNVIPEFGMLGMAAILGITTVFVLRKRKK